MYNICKCRKVIVPKIRPVRYKATNENNDLEAEWIDDEHIEVQTISLKFLPKGIKQMCI